jgi:hypothetical protein
VIVVGVFIALAIADDEIAAVEPLEVLPDDVAQPVKTSDAAARVLRASSGLL